MLLDPFTIIAQLFNFAILVVALKFLLYDRVIVTMDEREAKIAARIGEAEEREQEAERAVKEHREQRREFENDRSELMEQARHDADDRRRELLSDLRDEIDDQRCQWQQGLRREHEDLKQVFKRRSAEQVLAVARRALQDLADVNLDRRTIDIALDRLTDDEKARQTIFGDDADEITVVAAFPADSHRRHVVDRLTALGLREDQQVCFEQDSELVLGVEIRANSAAVSWNAADYLDRLGELLSGLLDDADGPNHDSQHDHDPGHDRADAN